MLLIMDRPAQSPDVIIIEAAWDLNRKQNKNLPTSKEEPRLSFKKSGEIFLKTTFKKLA